MEFVLSIISLMENVRWTDNVKLISNNKMHIDCNININDDQQAINAIKTEIFKYAQDLLTIKPGYWSADCTICVRCHIIIQTKQQHHKERNKPILMESNGSNGSNNTISCLLSILSKLREYIYF